MTKLGEWLSSQYKDKRGYREYHIAYYIRGFMSNKCLVGKVLFWDVKNKSIDNVALHGFHLSMGPHRHKFKKLATGWNFIYKDLTNYDEIK